MPCVSKSQSLRWHTVLLMQNTIFQAHLIRGATIIIVICLIVSSCRYLTKIYLSKLFILFCLVLLKSVLFKPCLFKFYYNFSYCDLRRKEGNVLFNDTLNTFYLRLYGIRHMVKEENHCHHIGYSFRLAARFFLYASSHRQDNTYHSLCYTSREALAGTRNSSMGPP